MNKDDLIPPRPTPTMPLPALTRPVIDRGPFRRIEKDALLRDIRRGKVESDSRGAGVKGVAGRE